MTEPVSPDLASLFGLLVPGVSILISEWLLGPEWMLPGYTAFTVIGMALLFGPASHPRRLPASAQATPL